MDLEPDREPTRSEDGSHGGDSTSPSPEWVINEDEELRIVPKQLVGSGAGAAEGRCIGPLAGRQREAGFLEANRAAAQAHFPTHLLAGAMVCGCCGATIAQVSGKSGGYYGCLAATKGACDNKTLVRRTLVEKVILGADQEQISDPEHIAYVLQRVEEEITKLRSDLPDTLKLEGG